MELFESLSLKKIFIITTGLATFSFFLLLVIANITSRKGIEEIGSYQKEINEYEDKITQLDYDIATYSSLVRIERRAREMGLSPATKTEYLK